MLEELLFADSKSSQVTSLDEPRTLVEEIRYGEAVDAGDGDE